MFKFKKNFTVTSSRLNSCSPVGKIRFENLPLALSHSPAKKLRFNVPEVAFNSPKKVRIDINPTIFSSPPEKQTIQDEATAQPKEEIRVETPPASPEVPIKTDLMIRDDLRAEVKKLDDQIEEEIRNLRDLMDKKAENERQRLIIDDYKQMAIKAQHDVRGICNEIYNPGVEMAAMCCTLIEESKRNHVIKFEKLAFEITERLEATEIAIRRKKEELTHELKLHERTLITVQQDREEQERRDREAKETTDQLVEDVSAKEGSEQADLANPGEGSEAGSEKTDNPDGDDTINLDDDENDPERTDAESGDEAIPELSFTPCQAQRPN